MEDPEGTLSFDFEGGLDAVAPLGVVGGSASFMPSDPTPSSSALTAGNIGSAASDAAAAGGNIAGRRSFRQTVCRHWLRSLCMKGDACGFLHQFDKARMPVCRFFRLYGECREQDCVYKHTNEDIKECNMYAFMFRFPLIDVESSMFFRLCEEFVCFPPLCFYGFDLSMLPLYFLC